MCYQNLSTIFITRHRGKFNKLKRDLAPQNQFAQ